MNVFHSEHNQSLSLCLSQVCVLALHLSKELCRADEDGEQWLQVVRKLPVLPSVLSALELSLRSKQNLYFTEAALHLLLTLARTPQVHTQICVIADISQFSSFGNHILMLFPFSTE